MCVVARMLWHLQLHHYLRMSLPASLLLYSTVGPCTYRAFLSSMAGNFLLQYDMHDSTRHACICGAVSYMGDAQ